MKLVAFTCPSCGAHLDVDVDNKTATCQYCGATFPVEDETQRLQLEGAEQAGYDFEKGRQKAQAEAAAQQVVTAAAAEAPKKRRTWLWVIGWIIIFPVPLTILMLRKKDLNPKIRYGIIAAAWLVYLAIGLFGNGGKSSRKAEETSGGVVAAQDATLTKDEQDTAQAEEKQEEDKDEPAEAGHDETPVSARISLTAGKENEYSELRVMNAGTEFEEKQLVYYVPAGTYEVTNVGRYPTQVSVYQGVHVTEEGWEEPENVGDILLLEAGESGEISVPDGYYIDILEPTEIELVEK